ncbi:MAG: antibiotic biosynthesis monooxygenase [Arenimonas sp.]|nr:antibiotic biosynthesis monooxygenase [Arenimonas sp.]
MFCAAFIYQPGEYDSEFHRLNDIIQAAAEAMPSYLGVESWQSADGRLKNATYYWSDLAALKEFSMHPSHLEAKRNYARWYQGYHIVISEVIRSYGDGKFPHITPTNNR